MPDHTPTALPPAETNRALDTREFRRVLGQYPTGVSVVTGIATDGSTVGLAVGSFTSVSLDPPLVAFMPASTSQSWPKIRETGRFCVNVLAADQEHICRSFATTAADKFAGLSWRPASSGAPILDDALAWIDCDLDTEYEAGDHLIVVGRVRDLHSERHSLPLLFFQGGYGRFASQSLALRDVRFATQLQLVDRARPLMEELAHRRGLQVGAAYCDGAELTVLATAGTFTDPRSTPAAVGQRLPVSAPIGIWWMAFAAPDRIETWLSDVESPQQKDRYRQALELIREQRYCLGLDWVHSQVETLINHRPGPGEEPSAQDRDGLRHLGIDPMHFVQSVAVNRRDERQPNVVSLWAPTFTVNGQVSLGLTLADASGQARPLADFAPDLLQLADTVSAMNTNSP
ncbi:flavin reductase [Nocardia sp. FBN12]|uniref:flavin reductase n=1 Tax=Nocardia sp. FBN12 TaxID=3419766 RepID=UPI003D0831C4